MKRAYAARSRRKNRSSAGVSLFPFLAVLMCTMGSLVVLLVVINRQGRIQAAEAARAVPSKSANKKEDLEAARELVQLQISQLKTAREKTETQLAEARLQLGHLEDHSRRLRDQLAGLQAAASQFDNLKTSGSQQQQALQAELDRVKLAVTDAQQRLAQAEQAAKSRQKSYAIVPYDGPNGTRRRPIYLECREDAVVLQPEGIRFTDSDFDGPLGPGNPLEAALRATREYLLSKGAIASDGSGEPYPLLLVRPAGIHAYYAARVAMKSWGFDFGYELIGEDWQLKFPQPDPQLAEVVHQTVDVARMRQQRLAEVAPRYYGGDSSLASSQPAYRAAPTRGGVVMDGEMTSVGGGSPLQQTRPARTFAGRSGVRGKAAEETSGPQLQESSLQGPQQGSNLQAQQQGSGLQSPQQGSKLQGSEQGSELQGPQLQAAGSQALQASPQQQSTQPQPGQTAAALRPGEWIPYERPPDVRKQPPPEEKKNEKQPNRDEQRAEGRVRSLAETRGNNWGLPDASTRSVAITRPIRIECTADRLVVLAEPTRGEGQGVPLKGDTQDSVDAFVAAVWDHMDAWGIAGRGMYWKPVLKVQVVPGGENRFKDLQTLLEGSGLDVRQADALQ